jgi:hypothetical protein
MEGQTEEGFSQNLILLLIAELILGIYLLYRVFFVSYFTMGSTKNYVLGFLFTMIILGYLILQVPENTENDNFMFTLDLIIIPFVLMVCVIAKILFEGKQTNSFVNVSPRPNPNEAMILSAPRNYRDSRNYRDFRNYRDSRNYRNRGGGKGRSRSI